MKPYGRAPNCMEIGDLQQKGTLLQSKRSFYPLLSFTCIVKVLQDQISSFFFTQISSTKLQAYTTFLEIDWRFDIG